MTFAKKFKINKRTISLKHPTYFIAEIGLNEKEIYFTNDWEHPHILELDPPLVLDAGQGFKLIATYNNTRGKEVGFGFLSTDEMMILFGLYYTD